jgi:microtubule-associated protein-like 6
VSGDEFMAVKPFLGVVRNSVPSDWNDSKVKLSDPDCSMDLEYVHGYRCFDTRNNIFFIDGDNITFHTAAVSVKMNLSKNKQVFNFGNSDDITAVAKHKNIMATG